MLHYYYSQLYGIYFLARFWSTNIDNSKECEEEIQTVHARVQELTGQEMMLFRPPYGVYNDDVIKSAVAIGYYPVMYSIDSMDWKDYGSNAIVETVAGSKYLGNGAIIRFHSGAKYTLEAIQNIIANLKAENYEIVKTSELIYKDNYYLDKEGTQIEK